jgi:hypothetical protein
MREQIEASGETEKTPEQVAIELAREDMRFVGREFCSWLLFHAEEGDGLFGDGDEAFTLRPGTKLVLKGFAGELHEARLSGPAPGASLEARYEIGRGTPVAQLELLL